MFYPKVQTINYCIMKKLYVYLIPFYLLTSCATFKGTMNFSSFNRNVKYVDAAIGVAQTQKYLFIGGLSQDALVLEAKREMQKSRPLKSNEEYANTSVDFKTSYYFVYITTKVTVSADIVQFTNDSIGDRYSETYRNKIIERIAENDIFKVGDSILTSKLQSGTLISMTQDGKAFVLFSSGSGKAITKKISIKDIYYRKQNYRGLNLGDRYKYYQVKNNRFDESTGTIVAFGLDSLLVRSNENNILKVEYNK